MTDSQPPSPSATSADLFVLSPDEARALVDKHFSPMKGPSPLVAFRLSDDSQADWKCEFGQWLRRAEDHGFLPALLSRLDMSAHKAGPSTDIDPNDPLHRKLKSELAAPMLTHYLLGTGWTFEEWEPITGGAVDVDVSLTAPDGVGVHFQAKAPDAPGRIEDHRVHDGENDEHVLKALDKAVTQLPRPASRPAFIAVSSQRRGTASLTQEPRALVVKLYGASASWNREPGVVRISQANRGAFFAQASDWEHVSGILLLDYLRGVESQRYACTVLLNPRATHPAHESWFPRARVCTLVGDRFQWVRGEPTGAHSLPNGTILAP